MEIPEVQSHIDVPEPPPPPAVGLELAGLALLLPIVAAVALFFITSVPLAFAISIGTVGATALLMAIDSARLGPRDKKGGMRESAVLVFFGMCALWIVAYPYVFFRRHNFTGPNLGYAALVVALFFTGGPFLAAMLIPPGLPSCNSTEVKQLLEQVIRSTPAGANVESIDGHRQVSFDEAANIRHGECVAHRPAGGLTIKYIVEWQDRDQGTFVVRLTEPQLPACDSVEVIGLLNQATTNTGINITSMEGHRELSFDEEAKRRLGECTAHTESGDIKVKFVVDWQDQSKSIFRVRLANPELPTCDSPDVKRLLEQVIRKGPVELKIKSIDGYRETSFDAAANVRYGECVLHTEMGDISVTFTVKWQDAAKGEFQVEIVESPQSGAAPMT